MLDSKVIQNICGTIQYDINTRLDYPESCYQQLLLQRLIDAGFQAEKEIRVDYKTNDGKFFGIGYIDILVESNDTVYILELKANKRTIIKKGNAQVKRYMSNFETDKEVKGYLVTFNCETRPYIFCEIRPPKPFSDESYVIENYRRETDVRSTERANLLQNYVTRMGSSKHRMKQPAVLDSRSVESLGGMSEECESQGKPRESCSELSAD